MFQNEGLRNIVNAPRYFTNSDLCKDLNIDILTWSIGIFAENHGQQLLQPNSVESIQLLDNVNVTSLLKTKKTFEFVK